MKGRVISSLCALIPAIIGVLLYSGAASVSLSVADTLADHRLERELLHGVLEAHTVVFIGLFGSCILLMITFPISTSL